MSTTTTKKSASDIEKLQTLLDNMSDEDRLKLAQAGIAVPNGDLTALAQDRPKWGLRCVDCNKIALYFVGSTWKWNDQTLDRPPGLPHYQVAWMQNLPPSEIDRHTPRCQHCSRPVRLNPDDSFNVERRRLVLIEDWEDSRDKRFDREAARKNDLAAGRGAAEAHLGDSTNFNAKPVPVSDTIVAQNGGDPTIKDQLEAVAEATGLAAAVRTGKL